MKKLLGLSLLALLPTLGFAEVLKPVALDSGTATLSPENTQIGFVGLHEGDEPKPRKGGFGDFSGKATFTDGRTLESLSFDIKTASIFTEISKLTNHLKSPDFFDVREHPTATFKSTSVKAAGGPGKFDVTGKLTLLGKSKEITLPVTVAVASIGVTLQSEVSIDRTDFGMNYGQGKVVNAVALTLVVGAPTKADK